MIRGTRQRGALRSFAFVCFFLLACTKKEIANATSLPSPLFPYTLEARLLEAGVLLFLPKVQCGSPVELQCQWVKKRLMTARDSRSPAGYISAFMPGFRA
jgi:hypothetical protein